MTDSPPSSTQLAGRRTTLAAKRTRLAFDRTKRAAERTLMAWIRTSLSMISFGFSIDTFFRAFIKAEKGVEAEPLTGPAVLGLVLVGLGTLVLVLGTIDHLRYLRKLGEELEFVGKRAPWTYMLFVAMMVILIGSAIFVYLLIQRGV
jgi:uncharacterized membrane protein YidH (DUF202 family)